MEKLKSRADDYNQRRHHLQQLSDEALKDRFWELAKQTVSPLVDLATQYTSPAIERSILLRMGFSSLEAKALVEKVMTHQLMPKGAGGVVYRYAQLSHLSIREAGLQLLQDIGWETVLTSFGRTSR